MTQELRHIKASGESVVAIPLALAANIRSLDVRQQALVFIYEPENREDVDNVVAAHRGGTFNALQGSEEG